MICHRCQCTDYYPLAGRKFVRCANCRHEFSETSGTVWKSSKLAPEKRRAIIDMLDAGKNRHAISVATGVQYHTVISIANRVRLEREASKSGVDTAKREYCGPYLMALPPPAWWRAYIPTVPPYRLFVTDGDKRSYSRSYQDQHEAMIEMAILDKYQSAELFDGNGDWLGSQGHPRSP
jgi:hypothetical protein